MRNDSPADPFRQVLVFLFGIGLAMGGLATYFYVDARHFVDRAVHADGVVVALRQVGASNTRRYAIVEFQTPSGLRSQFQSNAPGGMMPRFRIGERVDILYDPRDPSDARIHSFVDLWGLSLCLGCIGFVFTWLGCIWAIGLARDSRHQSAHGSDMGTPVRPQSSSGKGCEYR